MSHPDLNLLLTLAVLLGHPRWDGDAAHRWLRGCVQEVCGDAFADAMADVG